MSIPGSAEPLLLAQQDTGYRVERSLRFNSSDSAYLSRTPASAGNRKTWTWAGWVKRAKLGATQTFFMSAQDDSNVTRIRFESDDTLRVHHYVGNNLVGYRQTTQVFRDISAWYHIVWTVDTTTATGADRIKIFVNGTQITAFASTTDPSQNADLFINSTNQHKISSELVGNYLDLYLADLIFVDGQALTPSSFTEVSATTGQLIPKAYTGSFGTNGFWLKFSDNSAATATTLGKDYSGNSNNWTPNNFSVTSAILYSSTITLGSGGGDTTGGDNPKNAFDGSTSTGFGRGILQSATPNGGWSWNAAPYGFIATSTTAIRLYHCVRTGTRYYVNGSQVTPNFNGLVHPQSGWITLPTTNGAAITSISVNGTSDAAPQSCGEVYAIEINGTTIVDNSGAGNDSLVDTPTSYGTDTGAGGEVRGNYPTFNPLANTATLANGNLDISNTNTSWQAASTTHFASSGKWYAEVTVTSFTAPNAAIHIGIADRRWTPAMLGNNTFSYAYRSGTDDTNTGYKYYNNSYSAYGAYYVANDVISIAMDLDAGTLTFYKNGVSQGQAYSGLSGEFGFTVSVYKTGASINYGQRPWAYAPPANHKALVDTNLPAPVVAKPNTVMDVKTYTGNGSTQTISGLGFSPDLVWTKSRSSGLLGHRLQDIVRGATKELYSNATNAETTNTNSLTSFNSDGFSIGSENGINQSGETFVAWTWDAGTTTSSNGSGSITSSVRANASAGFSIVTYTGTGSAATVGHGLGVAPSMIIVKSRNTAATNWGVYHSGVSSTPQNSALNLDNTSAIDTQSVYWNNTAPTSTVFSVGTWGGSNGSTRTYVAYCFAPVAGYSSFGSYTGNGSATDGPFVYTGFRPRWVMIKQSSGSGTGWQIHDTSRNTYNVMNNRLQPNNSDAESTYTTSDFLSNGFKLRDSDPSWNSNGATYIYAAFAENPFAYARAR